MTRFISDKDHYTIVLQAVLQARRSVWIGTADIKDLYIATKSAGRNTGSKPFLGTLSDLLGKGIEVRLLHAKEPGQPFREDFDRYPRLAKLLERALCPRVHFKIIVIDGKQAYIGSANLTGAGMGMKAPNRRNFEAGIFTDEAELVDAAMEEFDKVWRGSECQKCGRKDFCGDPIR